MNHSQDQSLSQALRHAERQWRATGDESDRQRYLIELERVGLARSLSTNLPIEIFQFQLSYKFQSPAPQSPGNNIPFSNLDLLGRFPRSQLGPLRTTIDRILVASFQPQSHIEELDQNQLKSLLASRQIDGIIAKLPDKQTATSLLHCCYDTPIKALVINDLPSALIQNIEWARMPELQHLSLGAEQSNEVVFLWIPFERLEKLRSFSTHRPLIQSSIESLQHCQELEAIELNSEILARGSWDNCSIRCIHSDDLNEAEKTIGECPQLEQLVLLRRLGSQTKQTLSAIGQLTKLRCLSLRSNTAIFQGLKNSTIEVLHVSSQESLRFLAIERFSNLRQLHWWTRPSTAALEAVSIHWPHSLESVFLGPGRAIKLAFHGGSRLTSLGLANIELQHKACFEDLVNLRQVNMSMMKHLTSLHIKALARLPKLRFLRLNKCTGPSKDNQTLLPQLTQAPELKRLFITSSSASPNSIAQFRAQRPEIELICSPPDSSAEAAEVSAKALQDTQPEQALQVLMEALKDTPHAFQTCWLLCNILDEQGRQSESLEYLQKCLKYAHTRFLLNRLGEALRETGKPEQAIAVFTRSLKAFGPHEETLYERGYAAFKLNRIQAALQDLKAALKVFEAGSGQDPDNWPTDSAKDPKSFYEFADHVRRRMTGLRELSSPTKPPIEP